MDKPAIVFQAEVYVTAPKYICNVITNRFVKFSMFSDSQAALLHLADKCVFKMSSVVSNKIVE